MQDNEDYKDILAQLAKQVQQVRQGAEEIRGLWEIAANGAKQAQSVQLDSKENGENKELLEIQGQRRFDGLRVACGNAASGLAKKCFFVKRDGAEGVARCFI